MPSHAGVWKKEDVDERRERDDWLKLKIPPSLQDFQEIHLNDLVFNIWSEFRYVILVMMAVTEPTGSHMLPFVPESLN